MTGNAVLYPAEEEVINYHWKWQLWDVASSAGWPRDTVKIARNDKNIFHLRAWNEGNGYSFYKFVVEDLQNAYDLTTFLLHYQHHKTFELIH